MNDTLNNKAVSETAEKELPEQFKITAEQEAEIQSLVDELHAKCVEYEVPFLVSACTERSDTTFGLSFANYFNGERVPSPMALAKIVIQNNISDPIQLLAQLAKGKIKGAVMEIKVGSGDNKEE